MSLPQTERQKLEFVRLDSFYHANRPACPQCKTVGSVIPVLVGLPLHHSLEHQQYVEAGYAMPTPR